MGSSTFSYTAEPCLRRNSQIAFTSLSATQQPCTRVARPLPGGRKIMSPRPRSCSAPLASSTVRESTLDATWKAMRVGKLALISPVTTSTEGRWVATMRWMPTARAICARRTSEFCTSPAETIMRSANSSTTTTQYGSFSSAGTSRL